MTRDAFLSPPHRPHASNPGTSSPTLRFCGPCGRSSECPQSPNALPRSPSVGIAASRRWCVGAQGKEAGGGLAGEGKRGAARAGAPRGSRRPGCGSGVPGRPGRAGKARGARDTHPLLLPAADGHGGGGRGAVPELGRLPGSQKAPGEPAGPLAGHRPSRARSARPAGLTRADLLYPPRFRKRNSAPFPPLFLALLARGGFFSLAPPLSHPLLSAEASRRLSKLCAPPGARGQLGERPRPGGGASGAGAARDARGAAPTRAAPGLGWPPGAVSAAPGLRAGPARRPRPHVEVPRRAGALAAFAGLAQTFPGLARGRGPSPSALPAVERGQRLKNGLMAGISAASTPSGFPNFLCLKFLSEPWIKLPNSFKPQPVFRNHLLRAGSPCSGNDQERSLPAPP